jgi:hypothetical protein
MGFGDHSRSNEKFNKDILCISNGNFNVKKIYSQTNSVKGTAFVSKRKFEKTFLAKILGFPTKLIAKKLYLFDNYTDKFYYCGRNNVCAYDIAETNCIFEKEVK